MARVTASLCSLLLFYTKYFIESLPIQSGFSIKLKPLLAKDEIHPKTFGSIFAKISQDFTPEAILRQQIFSKVVPPPAPTLGSGCSNQVVRMLVPSKDRENYTQLWEFNDLLNNNDTPDTKDTPGFLYLPVIKQPFKDYKVLVATAPADLKIGQGENGKNVVIYVVFKEATSRDDSASRFDQIPEIYFVNKQNGFIPKEKLESKSIIFVDNNRTVTGLKSQQVKKLISFKNRLLNRYKYEISP